MATLATTARLPAERERYLALGAALVTVTLWASAFVGIRDAARHLSPGALAFGRLTIASVALGLIVLARREPLPSRRDLARIAFVGVFWFGLYNIALIEAEQRVDAGTAAMLVNIGPILIAVLAGLVLHEGFPPRLLGGMAIAFAGVIVIGSATSDSGLTPSWGALLCLAGELPDAPGSAIGWMVWLAVGPMALGFLTWGYALARTTAGRMGSMTYLVPPIAILLGWLILEETPPTLALAGGALCLAGVVFAQRRPATGAARRRS
jgi:drug/metabolite transporter (DMT)-like permease